MVPEARVCARIMNGRHSMLGESGLDVLKNSHVFLVCPASPAASSLGGRCPQCPDNGSLRPGAWIFEVECPLAVPEGPGSLGCLVRLGVSSNGSAFCSLLRSLPPYLPLCLMKHMKLGHLWRVTGRADVHNWLASRRLLLWAPEDDWSGTRHCQMLI